MGRDLSQLLAGSGSAQRAGAMGGGVPSKTLSWSAMEIRAAKKSDLVSHTLSFKVVDFYVINYHFWQLKMHGGETGHMLNHET